MKILNNISKTKFSLIMLTIFFLVGEYSCKKPNKNCQITNEKITIEYLYKFRFDENSYIIIDNHRFTHSRNARDINKNNILPADKIVYKKKEREFNEDINSIFLGLSLGKKIIKTNEYEILNLPLLQTKGILSIKRKDGHKIKIETSKNYPARINNKNCFVIHNNSQY